MRHTNEPNMFEVIDTSGGRERAASLNGKDDGTVVIVFVDAKMDIVFKLYPDGTWERI